MLDLLEPNYSNPMKAQFKRLLNLEIQLVGNIEYHRENQNFIKLKSSIRIKKLISIRRKCLQAALLHKEKQEVHQHLSALTKRYQHVAIITINQ